MNLHESFQPNTDDPMDRILRTELRWHAPPDLTNQLLRLAYDPTESLQQIHPAPLAAQSKPTPWYTFLFMLLASIAVSLSFANAPHVYSMLGLELGFADMWWQIQSLFTATTQWLYQELPFARSVMPFLTTIYEQTYWLLNWILVAVILWLALDGQTSASYAHYHQTS